MLPLALLLISSVSWLQTEKSTRVTLLCKDLPSPVRKGSKTTYFELLRLVLPDLSMGSEEARAHKTVPIRSLAEKGEPAAWESDFKLDGVEPLWIVSQGKPALLLTIELSGEDVNQGTPYEGEANLLAAFTLEPTPRLLDVMDIKTDRFTDFWGERPALPLNPQNHAFVIYNTHWNAGENYNDLFLLFLDDSRFKVVTNIFIFNTQGCGATFSETPHFRALPGPGNGYPKILVRVEVQKLADGKECDRQTGGYKRSYQGIYYWNRTKADYEGGSRQLDSLGRFNRQRLGS